MNKKIIIISIILIVVVGIIGILIIRSGSSREMSIKETIDLSNVFDTENIEEIKIKINKEKEINIANRYNKSGNCYIMEANVEFMDTKGKMIYIRNNINNLNIYQTEYEINIYENPGIEIEGTINNFEELIKRYLKTEEEATEEIEASTDNKYRIPLGEEIYNENKQLTKTYDIENNTYEINFYKKDKKLICEFVKVL